MSLEFLLHTRYIKCTGTGVGPPFLEDTHTKSSRVPGTFSQYFFINSDRGWSYFYERIKIFNSNGFLSRQLKDSQKSFFVISGFLNQLL